MHSRRRHGIQTLAPDVVSSRRRRSFNRAFEEDTHEQADFGWSSTEDVESKLNYLQDCCLYEMKNKGIPEILSQIENEMADYAPRRSLDE